MVFVFIIHERVHEPEKWSFGPTKGGGSDPRLVCIVYVFGLKLFVFSLGWTNGALPVGITDQLLLQVLFDDSPDILQKSDKGQIF